MTHNRSQTEPELTQQLLQALSGLAPDQLGAVVQQLVALGTLEIDPVPPIQTPSRRRRRRRKVVTYRVRIDLRRTKPPLWRRLELASDLFLDEVHEIIQAAFGWTDSHLHRFSSGPLFSGGYTEEYLSPIDIDEGEVGIPEEEVRLDEVLVDVGDKLYYTYDFGDNWEHVIRLEAVSPRAADASRATCIGGRRPGPPEDCGGVAGYELLVAPRDPGHRHNALALSELAHLYGDEINVDAFELTALDIDAINADLSFIHRDADLDHERSATS